LRNRRESDSGWLCGWPRENGKRHVDSVEAYVGYSAVISRMISWWNRHFLDLTRSDSFLNDETGSPRKQRVCLAQQRGNEFQVSMYHSGMQVAVCGSFGTRSLDRIHVQDRREQAS
jgi:hypothetical protein